VEKEFVPFELTVKLKALGFDEPCQLGWYLPHSEIAIKAGVEPNYWQLIPTHPLLNQIAAPLYQQAFRWFREKYNIFPEILTDCTTRPKFCYTYTKFFGNQNDLASEEWGWEPNVGQYSLLYKTYEEAQIACLEKLIEIAEQI
jgi:hypothetical protein